MNRALRAHRMPQIDPRDSWDTYLQTLADMSSERLKTFRATQQKAKRFSTKIKANLVAACRYYKTPISIPRHRALADAKNAMKLFHKQRSKNKWILFDNPV